MVHLSFAISGVFQSRDKSSCSKSKSSLGLEIPLRETLLGLHMCKVESRRVPHLDLFIATNRAPCFNSWKASVSF